MGMGEIAWSEDPRDEVAWKYAHAIEDANGKAKEKVTGSYRRVTGHERGQDDKEVGDQVFRAHRRRRECGSTGSEGCRPQVVRRPVVGREEGGRRPPIQACCKKPRRTTRQRCS